MPRSTAAERCGGSRSRPAWRSTSRRATRPDGGVGVDLVVADLVTGPLELDRAEQELGRPVPRARRVEAREPAGEVDEGDPHAGRGYRRRPSDPRLPSRSMHRQRTKLAKRVNRVASSVERRGIVATYEIHDRLLGNRSARRRFASHVPELDETQRRLVEALDRDGYVSLPFTDLVGEEQSGRRSTPRAPPSSRRPSARWPRADSGKVRARQGVRRSVPTASRASRSGRTTRGSRPAPRGGCSTSRTRTCASGRSSRTSTSGTRRSSRRRTSGWRRRTGTSTSTTSTC